MNMFASKKPTASLSSGLLARKGHARPAMRPQGFVGMTQENIEDLGWNDMGEAASADHSAQDQYVQDQVGPLGEVTTQAPPEQPAGVPSVLRERNRLDEQFAATREAPQPEAAAPAGDLQDRAIEAEAEPASDPDTRSISVNTAKRLRRETAKKRGRAAFTLRLDTERHLRLRLASAIRNQSAQTLVTEAVDAFLETMPEVDDLVHQVGGAKAR